LGLDGGLPRLPPLLAGANPFTGGYPRCPQVKLDQRADLPEPFAFGRRQPLNDVAHLALLFFLSGSWIVPSRSQNPARRVIMPGPK
jgi:hypothetical protein